MCMYAYIHIHTYNNIPLDSYKGIYIYNTYMHMHKYFPVCEEHRYKNSWKKFMQGIENNNKYFPNQNEKSRSR
jgi:hypothetical protein